MIQLFAIVMATLAAALSPVIAIALFIVVFGGRLFDPWLLLFLVFGAGIALAYTLLFGLLTVAWLIQTGRFRARPMLVAGLLIGAVPTAFWHHPWPRKGSSFSAITNNALTIDNSVVTLAGWLQYFQHIGLSAILGAISAMAFYCVYKSIYPYHSQNS